MSDNPFADQGRIGIQIEETEFTIAPAGNTTVQLTLRNQGLEEDTFSLTVGGIPSSWISTASPNILLGPGEETPVEDAHVQHESGQRCRAGRRVELACAEDRRQ